MRASLPLPLVCLVLACSSRAPPPAPAAKGVRVVAAGAGPVDALVREAMRGAEREGRVVLVYEGATWCEPCREFKGAVEQGELADFTPGLLLLEFDADRDDERLGAAGYGAPLVPMFALPQPDGRASGKATSGVRKGANAVADLTPRLRALVTP